MNNLGEYIKKIRTDKKMSQDELAQKLYVSRQAISNWECGKTYPDIDNLKMLSDIFDIKLETLIAGGNNSENVTSTLYIDNIKLKKNKKKYLISIIIILLAFLSYFFLNTYNKVKVYSIECNDDNIFIENGLFVATNETWFLNINNINTTKELDVVKIYYKIKNKDRLIGYPFGSNINLKENIGYGELFPFNETITINNMYLDIYYTDGTMDTVKLIFNKEYDNRKLFMHKDVIITENTMELNDNYGIKDEFKELDKVMKDNFKYSKGNAYVATIKYNNKKYNIEYEGFGGGLIIHGVDNVTKETGRYSALLIKGYQRGDISYSGSKDLHCIFDYDKEKTTDDKNICDESIRKEYLDLLEYILNSYKNNN